MKHDTSVERVIAGGLLLCVLIPLIACLLGCTPQPRQWGPLVDEDEQYRLTVERRADPDTL